MDENRLEGRTARIATIKESFGPATDDVETQRRGAGPAPDAHGQAADATRNFHQWLRNTIEAKPHTSALVALGIGWLLGRMHLPS
jgi:uncharacterized protein YjbJ (UPF0337 family)